MTPKGILLIIGGAEDKGDSDSRPDIADKNSEYEHFEILKELIKEKLSSRPLEIITTGTEVPDEIKKMYMDTFKKIGYKNIGFLVVEDKMEAAEEKVLQRIQKAGAVLFSGGDQFRISTILGGTPMAEVLREKYFHDNKFIIAGTSAGAMVLSRIMISKGGTNEALVSSDLNISSGLGLLETCIVDTHFIKRGRFGRLAHAVIINPGQLGIGLGEDTALVIRKGNEAECYGSGMVVIIDGENIGQTNIAEVGDDCPAFVENLTVHLLVKGCRFSLKTKQLTRPPVSKSKSK